jgi:hypothetical protein
MISGSPTPSHASVARSDMRSSLSPAPGNGLDRDNTIKHTLSVLETQINKLLSVLTVDVCAHKDTKKAVTDIVDNVELIKAHWTIDQDDETARRIDASATTMWNNVLAFTAGLQEHGRGAVLHTVALLRYASATLFYLCRMGTGTQLCSDEVMLACSRAAIDLFAADRVSLAEDVLTRISTQISAESDDHHTAERIKLSLVFKESRSLYWLARCVMARKMGAGGATDYIQRALLQCYGLPSQNSILAEVMTALQDIALERMTAMQGHDVTELESEQLKEIIKQLDSVIASWEKRSGISDAPTPETIVDLKRTYARSLLHYGWANSADPELERAGNILREALNASIGTGQQDKASKDGLLLLLLLEDRLAPFEYMLSTFERVFAVLTLNEENIAILCDIIQRASNREQTSELPGYLLAVVKLFCQSLPDDQENDEERSSWMARIACNALEASSASRSTIIQDLVNLVESKSVIFNEETSTSWLQLLVGNFCNLDEKAKRTSVQTLAVAASPIFANSPSSVSCTLKLAVYYSLQFGQLSFARELLRQCTAFPDPVLAAMDCCLGIKEKNEEYAFKALNYLSLYNETSEKLLMALLDEAIAQNMLSIAPSIMHMLLKTQSKDSHSLERLAVLR